MITLSQLIARTLERWRRESVPFSEGAAPERLSEFQRNRAIELPADLLRFLVAADGMVGLAWDEQLIRFWPVEEYRPIRTLFPHLPVSDEGDLVAFADYSLNAAFFVIRVNSMFSEIHLTDGETLKRVAGSFFEFLELYVVKSRMLLTFP